MEKYIDKKTNKVVIKIDDNGKEHIDKEWKDKKTKEKKDGDGGSETR